MACSSPHHHERIVMRTSILCLACTLLVSPIVLAKDPRPVLIDTDIGGDIDDALALALAVASPEIELVGVTTVGKGETRDRFVRHITTDRDEDRAWMVCRFLTQVGHKNIPVAAGAEPQPKSEIDWQIQYRRHPAAIYNRTLSPVKESAVELMTRLAKEKDGLSIIALGPLTNVARFIKEQPEAAKRLEQIVVMGGSIAIGYDGQSRSRRNIKMISPLRNRLEFGFPEFPRCDGDREGRPGPGKLFSPDATYRAKPLRVMEKRRRSVLCAGVPLAQDAEWKHRRRRQGMTIGRNKEASRRDQQPVMSCFYRPRAFARQMLLTAGASHRYLTRQLSNASPRLRGLRHRHRETLVDVRQAGDEGCANARRPGVSRRAHARFRRSPRTAWHDVPSGDF
jgi:hypothetical protein